MFIRMGWTCVLLLTLCVFHASGQSSIPDGRDDLQDWVDSWNRNYTQPEVALDRAWLSLLSEIDSEAEFYTQHYECFGCPMDRQAVVPPGDVFNMVIQTKYKNHIEVRLNDANNTVVCRDTKTLLEKGDYWVVVSGNPSNYQCYLFLANNPENIYLHILWLFLALVGIALVWILITLIIRTGCHKHIIGHGSLDLVDTNSSTANLDMKGATLQSVNKDGATVLEVNNSASASAPAKPQPAARQRLKSLDTFRGLSLVIMIFVNYGGGGYWIFEHPPWNGLSVADLVFPWFVFIMGTSMAFSFRGMLRRNTSRPMMVVKVLRRTVLLFCIGISLNSGIGVRWKQLRIPGVLQRLALTYLLVAIWEPLFVRASDDNKDKPWAFIRDITDYWPAWIVNLGYLAFHLGMTFGLNVPGCPRGYLGPGGMHDGGAYFNCTGGAAGYIDRQFFTTKHLYQWATIKNIYKGDQVYDPEGILGTFSSSFMCFLGLQAGRILVYHKAHHQRVIRWVIWGCVTGAIGTLLCKASQNDGWIPINKNLWSVSFSLTLSGLAFLFLAVLYCIVDVWDIWSGSPVYYPGMNSLVIYVCQHVFATYIPVRWVVDQVHWRLLALCSWSTAFWIIVAYVLFRKKIFIAL